MDNFTKKKVKKPSKLVKDFKKGDFSLTKKEFDLKKSKKTVNEISKDGKKIKDKLEKLKNIQGQIIDKESPEKKRFIARKKPKEK